MTNFTNLIHKAFDNNKTDLSQLRTLLAPHTDRAYLVGGYVRDTLMGRESHDYDVEIYDIKPAEFDVLMERIGANCVGKSYFIYKFKNYDFGLPRTENKTGRHHRDFSVSYVTDERAASMRRDFTINAMMINLFSGELLDFWGGQNDLECGILRHINDDKFCEDALRVLRGVQFSARLNFTIAPETLKLMKRLDLGFLSRDRICAELLKFFRSLHLDTGVRYLHALGLIGRYFGINLDEIELAKFERVLKNARKFIADERLFLYILSGFYGADIREITQNLRLPNSFLSILKEPFFLNLPSDKELLEVALKMPLKSWLGCYDETRVRRAKELGAYEIKFDSGVNASEIVAKGFAGAAIGAEILRRQNLAIDTFLTKFKAKFS